MYDWVVILGKEYLWAFAGAACIVFRYDCEKKRRFLTTPSDYFIFGMFTVWIIDILQKIPMG